MATAWFVIIVLMLTTYVVLDGFDFGAGILHPFVARTDSERRVVFSAIGPLWDGNEVWLITSGGIIFFAFPHAYAAGFSGFYLPLMFALWLLIARGIAIEFRSKEEHPLWHSFWDALFFGASAGMAFVLGVALANVIRGVPLDANGYFGGPLFTDFRTGPNPGVLDWYTTCIGLFAVAVLANHGALYLTWKTAGEVQERSRRLAQRIWPVSACLGIASTAATFVVQPIIPTNFIARPLCWVLAALVLIALPAISVAHRRRRELMAFLSSSLFIAALLGVTGAAGYPYLLFSTHATVPSITIANAAAGPKTLYAGFLFWSVSIVLAIGYFVYLFLSFAGKVRDDDRRYSH
jgi:cytochrome bd ubiquinol oxidase subunit II